LSEEIDMRTKVESKTAESSEKLLTAEKLNTVIRLLEDLYILQALSMGVGRESIRSVLGVHTTRVSNINKGVKRALENGKD
jgi:hypothetical protein